MYEINKNYGYIVKDQDFSVQIQKIYQRAAMYLLQGIGTFSKNLPQLGPKWTLEKNVKTLKGSTAYPNFVAIESKSIFGVQYYDTNMYVARSSFYSPSFPLSPDVNQLPNTMIVEYPRSSPQSHSLKSPVSCSHNPALRM